MIQLNFHLDYNVTGQERKRLVDEIAKQVGEEARYLGAPSFAYEVGQFRIDRLGTVTFDHRIDAEQVKGLVTHLADQGFVLPGGVPKVEDEAVPATEVPAAPEDEDRLPDSSRVNGLDVILPADTFDAISLANLKNLVKAKQGLICKALGVEKLPIIATEETVSFPWFNLPLAPEEAGVYARFISALAGMARKQQRVTAQDKVYDNDRYAFRCFLLRLGYIGADFKADRKVLLRRLNGSSAFKSGAKKPAPANEAAQPADAAEAGGGTDEA